MKVAQATPSGKVSYAKSGPTSKVRPQILIQTPRPKVTIASPGNKVETRAERHARINKLYAEELKRNALAKQEAERKRKEQEARNKRVQEESRRNMEARAKAKEAELKINQAKKATEKAKAAIEVAKVDPGMDAKARELTSDALVKQSQAKEAKKEAERLAPINEPNTEVLKPIDEPASKPPKNNGNMMMDPSISTDTGAAIREIDDIKEQPRHRRDNTYTPPAPIDEPPAPAPPPVVITTEQKTQKAGLNTVLMIGLGLLVLGMATRRDPKPKARRR